MIANMPYFAVLKERLGFINDRQRVLAENVANASTPGYVPRDMDERAFSDIVARTMPAMRPGPAGPIMADGVRMATTRAGHISGGAGAGSVRTVRSPDSETTLDGNAVVLEEQMIKVADARMNYDMALGLYQKGLQLMRLAARRPGG
ncbi:MAG: flagellar biosynthesis protein FlgB [Hyphomonadaceae bacterium]|jgi:flagellar basal-body rod protein FlgB|nr:flagellar biosynthesis protein FlgB [Hyphomonadaceae bacterium]